jgi:hypothetical protein
MNRTVGYILIAVAVGICVIGSALLGVGLAGNQLAPAGAVLGFGLLFVVLVAPLAGGGIYAIVRGRREAETDKQAQMQRKILDMVKARGQVSVSDVIVELQSSLPEVQDMIYKLVGMGVFSGYINWDEGTLFSEQASALRDLDQCRNCGGQLSLAGKGVVKCPFCGTEYFLT